MNETRPVAASTLTYVVRALLARPESQRSKVVGVGAKPWCEILERTSRCMARDVRPVLMPLLSEIISHASDLSPDQRELVGLAARRMLEFAWSEDRRDTNLIRVAIRGVCRTFEAAPGESEALLRRILERDQLAAYGFYELPALARELERLLALAPVLVADTYRAALLFREGDGSQTELGGGLVMRFKSTRRQDYDMALYTLGELFPRFMKTEPVEATSAAIAAVEAEATKRGVAASEWPLLFGSLKAKFADDLSHIWDATPHRHDAHFTIIDNFENELVRLADQSVDPELRKRVLERVVRDNRFAALWRKVLSAAIRAPTTLGREIWPLVAAVPVLVSGDTVELAGKFLQSVFPLLSKNEREAIEKAVLSIQSSDSERAPFFDRRKHRLLGCIATSHVVTEEARAEIEKLTASGSIPLNNPLFQLGEVEAVPYSAVNWLTEQGVRMDEEPNKRVHDLYDPVAMFEHKFLNDTPTKEDAQAVLASARVLHEALAESGGQVDPRVAESGWTHLARACSAIARGEWLENEQTILVFVRGVLLDASRHDCPTPDAKRDEQFELHDGVLATPRWAAAEGLLNLAQSRQFANSEVMDAIRRLAQDQVPQVRAEVAAHLSGIYHTASEVFWELLQRLEKAESSRRVIQYGLTIAKRLATQHGNEVTRTAHTLFDRFRTEPNASEIRQDCLSIVLSARVRSADPYGDRLVNEVISNMAELTEEAVRLVQLASKRLLLGPIEPSDGQMDVVRQASFTFLNGITHAAREWFAVLEEQSATVPIDVLKGQYHALHEVACEIAKRVYFASGSFAERMANRQPARVPPANDIKARFLREALPLLTSLSELAFPDVIHHVLETLEAYVAIDPRQVFLTISRAVQRGEASGYQYDGLAADLVVKIVRQYLADYRYLFRDDADCRQSLTDILNTFVRAGWPEAMALTFRLEEIYR